MKDVKYDSNFGGVSVLPVYGTTPKYLSQDYWNFFGRILQDAKKLDLDVIWYDDVDYPSGSAGGEFKKAYPEVMTFTCDVVSPKRGEDDLRVDYLDPLAVEKYVNYFFSNSTVDMVNTFVHVRGKIIHQLWNPYNGTISRINNVGYLKEGNDMYTRIPLKLGAVQSVFIIAKSIGRDY